MTDLDWKLMLSLKDFTGRGEDRFYWFKNDELSETDAEEVVRFEGAVVCHDFWIIRDVLFDKTNDLPRTIIDLDEFRIATSGNPEDRISREKVDITRELEKYGATADICGTYNKMFNRGVEFDPTVATEAAKAMEKCTRSCVNKRMPMGSLTDFLRSRYLHIGFFRRPCLRE